MSSLLPCCFVYLGMTPGAVVDPGTGGRVIGMTVGDGATVVSMAANSSGESAGRQGKRLPKSKCCTTGNLPSTSALYILIMPVLTLGQ